MTIDIMKIHIPVTFLKSTPKAAKMTVKRELRNRTNYSAPITLDNSLHLIDGYALLLAYLEEGITDIPYYIDNDSRQRVPCIPAEEIPELYAMRDLGIVPEDLQLQKYLTYHDKDHGYFLQKLAEEQDGKCYICGRTLGACAENTPTIDHIQPKLFGGTSVRSNLAVACLRCNQLKGVFVFSEELREIIKKQRDYEESYKTK